MNQPHRIEGGLIDQSRALEFRFNGQGMVGHPGDTLASALLANGRRLVARSFKYHRPRGIFSAGSEEPSALVQLGSGAHTEPNTRATTIQLFDGLVATSQNHLGSLEFDLMSVNDALSPFMSAGFYYKTFMWPKSFWERLYEPAIRSSAGLGRLSGLADPDIYDKGFIHCDILVIGGGACGLQAAITAARSGARVVLADEDFKTGGRLNSDTYLINGQRGCDWAKQAIKEARSLGNLRLMSRTTVFGTYDHGIFGALERKTDHLADSRGKPRQVLWRIYSKRSILCSGATERSIAFGNNDRPGIMLAGAVRTYVNRFAVAPGNQVAIFTNNDSGWSTADGLIDRGIEVAAIIDTRPIDPPEKYAKIRFVSNGRIVNTSGRKGLRSITLNCGTKIATDCLAVSGGWNPNVHLSCHLRSRPVWNSHIAAFVPGSELPQGMQVAGAANGSLSLRAALDEGAIAAKRAASELGFKCLPSPEFDVCNELERVSAFWHVADSRHRAWLDLQNDVVVKDVALSFKEGFRSVEHLKRYTTLGMATDQGKTANVSALAILAAVAGKSIEETGTTIYRPPFTPVPIGAFAGRSRGKHFRPTRLTASHEWAEGRGAVFVQAGNWLRAQWYPLPGESHWRQSVDREVLATRSSVGVCDVTTLGKIDIQGRDAATLLNRVYCNGFAKLQVGRVRYGLMLREDGIAYDDGTTARLGENHFVMTTTTANAVLVFRQLEFARQCLWPDLDVHLISVTDGWAQFSVAGPNSRNLIAKIIDPDFDLSTSAFPFMACSHVTVCGGIKARLFRISFSGELAYEIAVPASYGNSMMKILIDNGQEFDAVPYGTEALGVMRIEKGHFAGNELNGQTTALNLGVGRMVSTKKDSIGSMLSRREELNRDDIMKLVGLRPTNRSDKLNAGAHFISPGREEILANDEGWLSSVAYSPTFGHYIGLGFLKNGSSRHGEIVLAADPARKRRVEVEICSPHFYDPEGAKQRA